MSNKNNDLCKKTHRDIRTRQGVEYNGRIDDFEEVGGHLVYKGNPLVDEHIHRGTIEKDHIYVPFYIVLFRRLVLSFIHLVIFVT